MSDEPTVLVVDDNRPLADGFAKILEDEYEVLTAYGGEEALNLLDDSIDAVLLDRRLPDIPGDDVLREIRTGDYDCRVAVVSAADPNSDLDCEAYLTKPVWGSDVLRDTVTDLLDEDGRSTDGGNRTQTV
ncbi:MULTISPECIES: response regulator [Halorussus]|uniref:response regulator n=1 Tax=Halorussus TaxID=1070314 RepID=UPI00209E8D05|nr:response regulator [Halorussus vallis]USZ77548.1 response regulator [Halorussus vallis]